MRRVILTIAAILCLAVGTLAAWLYTPDKPRAALEAIYAAPPSQFVTVDGVRLHVRDTGPRTAPALILLHGFGSSLHTWDDWAALLDPSFRVIRYDEPGFGLTGADPSGDYSDTRGTTVLAGLMDALGIPSATIIGNSMGGRIAWTFAATHPDRVGKLVLMAPDGFQSPGLEYGKKPEIPAMMKVLPYVLPTVMLRQSLAPAYVDRSVMTEALVTRYRDMMRAPGVRQAILDRMAQTILVDPVPLLRRITAPTLLLWGEKDGMVPETNAADYLGAIRGSRLVVLPNRGHLLFEEAAAEAIVPLKAFLAE